MVVRPGQNEYFVFQTKGHGLGSPHISLTGSKDVAGISEADMAKLWVKAMEL